MPAEPLRVLIVASSYLPCAGGLQHVAASLAQGLLARGVAVEVLAQRYPRRLPAAERRAGVPVRRLLFLLPRLGHLPAGRLDLFLAGLTLFPLTLIRLVWHLWRQRPAVVNLHFVGPAALFLLLAGRLVRFRYVVSLHGDDVVGLARGTAFDRWLFRATLRAADAVTACSRHLLEQALALEPSARPRARVIPNGVAANPYAGWAGAGLMAVGRLVPAKGFDVLLHALARCPGQTLTLVGDGPERAALEILAGCLDLAERVAFCGLLPPADVPAALANCALVVVPSRQDSFGLVAVEAMAAGKPVVASCVGGLPEVLAGAAAMLVPPEDAAALAAAIQTMSERLAVDPGYGAENARIAARFSHDVMLRAYLETYR